MRTADLAASKLFKAVQAELAAAQALRRAASSAVDALSALVEAQQLSRRTADEEAGPAPGVAAVGLGGGWAGGAGEPPALQMRNPWAWGAEGSGGAMGAAAGMEAELRGMQADCLAAAREALRHRSLALELVQGVQRDVGLLSRECGEGLEAAARGLEGRAVAAHATSTGKLQEVGGGQMLCARCLSKGLCKGPCVPFMTDQVPFRSST